MIVCITNTTTDINLPPVLNINLTHSVDLQLRFITMPHFSWRQRKILRRAERDGSIMLAAPPSVLQLLPATSLPTTDGRLLAMTFLPDLLNKKYPDWNNQLNVQVESAADCLAVLALCPPPGALSLSGIYAHRLSDYLYASYGLITKIIKQQLPCDLKKIAAEITHVQYHQFRLPIAAAEAVLLAEERTSTVNDVFLRQLARQARKAGFTL